MEAQERDGVRVEAIELMVSVYDNSCLVLVSQYDKIA